MELYAPRAVGPRHCLVLWNRSVVRRLVGRFGARPLPDLANAYAAGPRARSAGFAIPGGIGAPTTISRCEELAAVGTEEFVSVGYAGALSADLAPGDIVVCDRAVRDEGTSPHYAPAHVAAVPSRPLRRWLGGALRAADLPFAVGASWTTDAPYRETRAELRHYRSLGVRTVDMEASALFVFARSRRVRAASVFVISDVLTERSWHPHFHRQRERLEAVAAALLRGWTAPGGSGAARRRPE